MSPYWTSSETAAFLRCSVRTLHARRAAGEFVEGVHFHLRGPRSGPGRRTITWFPAAVRAAIEAPPKLEDVGDMPVVPLARSSFGGRL